MNKVIDLKAAKKAADQRKYGDLVLANFDDFKHRDERKKKEQAAEVHRQARNKL